MADDLPTEFDLIVIGTGIVESIVSAAASRIGKRVLQVDVNNYYGNNWASFNFEDLQALKNEDQSLPNLNEDTPEENQTELPLGNHLRKLTSFEFKWHIPEAPEINQKQTDGSSEKVDVVEHESLNDSIEQTKSDGDYISEYLSDSHKELTQDDIKKNYRKFIIDLCPKLHFARGDFVELLISSNIARYAEFRSVSRILTSMNGKLEVVPCSRSDVFANNRVSVVEKRMLMKLLESIQSCEVTEDSKCATFKEFLKNKKLSDNIIHFVLYALSMSNEKTTLKEGIENTKKFLKSLGRFGKTPFLFSMYGSGEIPQAFCRLSAVFGGIFALNQPLHSIVIDEKFESLICGSQKIFAPYLVMEISMVPKEFIDSDTKIEYIYRAVFITDKSLMPSEKEHLTLLLYPGRKDTFVILELGCLTGTCPKDFFLVHVVSKGSEEKPEDHFSECIKELFTYNEDNVKPRILWSSFFALPNTNHMNVQKDLPKNMFACPGPDFGLDYDNSVIKAKEIFKSIYPNEEFLPRAPDADEIIIGEDAEKNDENEKNTSENTSKNSEKNEDEKIAPETINKSSEKNAENGDILSETENDSSE